MCNFVLQYSGPITVIHETRHWKIHFHDCQAREEIVDVNLDDSCWGQHFLVMCFVVVRVKIVHANEQSVHADFLTRTKSAKRRKLFRNCHILVLGRWTRLDRLRPKMHCRTKRRHQLFGKGFGVVDPEFDRIGLSWPVLWDSHLAIFITIIEKEISVKSVAIKGVGARNVVATSQKQKKSNQSVVHDCSNTAFHDNDSTSTVVIFVIVSVPCAACWSFVDYVVFFLSKVTCRNSFVTVVDGFRQRKGLPVIWSCFVAFRFWSRFSFFPHAASRYLLPKNNYFFRVKSSKFCIRDLIELPSIFPYLLPVLDFLEAFPTKYDAEIWQSRKCWSITVPLASHVCTAKPCIGHIFTDKYCMQPSNMMKSMLF